MKSCQFSCICPHLPITAVTVCSTHSFIKPAPCQNSVTASRHRACGSASHLSPKSCPTHGCSKSIPTDGFRQLSLTLYAPCTVLSTHFPALSPSATPHELPNRASEENVHHLLTYACSFAPANWLPVNFTPFLLEFYPQSRILSICTISFYLLIYFY